MQTGNSVSEQHDCAVIIIGGGPCGLMLAIELGRRDIPVILLEEKTSPARFPAANATQARTMEHYRRLGFAEKVRAQGLPPDYPTDIAYFTRYTKHELARFSLPSARAAREMVKTLTGSWSAAELPHRVSQMFVEGVLREEAAACPTVSIRPGWRMTAIRDTETGVEVDAEHDGRRTTLRAAYAIGADGGSSPTRKALGYSLCRRKRRGARLHGRADVRHPFPQRQALRRHAASARLDVLDRERRPPRLHGDGERPRPVQLPHPAQARRIRKHLGRRGARRCSRRRWRRRHDIEIIARSAWNAGYTLVAEKFQRGRVFLGGDAAHLFTPAGGLGYNTAVEDAVNLGWKLAAVLKGWGGPALLDTYETERQAIAKRNTAYARGFADSLGLFVPPPELEDDSPAGAAARKLTGDHFNHHARFEFNIPGITFGGRYDGSPIVVPDGTAPPPDKVNTYQATACPGGRAPHLWLGDGRSLYDTLGFEFTLLQLGDKPADAAAFRAAADALNMPLSVVRDRRRRSARSLRRRSGADPARPDRGVARQFGGGRRRRAAPRHRALTD